MNLSILHDSAVSARLYDPYTRQHYTGSGWTGTPASAQLISLTLDDIGDPDYDRYSGSTVSWPTGDYIVEYIEVSTSSVINEEKMDNGNELAIKTKTDNLPSDPADASDISASFSAVNSSLSSISGYIDTEVSAIKAKTDNLPSDPADQSAVESAITAAINGLNDVSVADILAGTVDGTLTIKQAMMVCASALVGTVTGGGTDTIVIKGAGNSTTRITAVVDENGNRTVTLSMV